MSYIAAQLREVRQRIATLAAAAGRPEDSVRLLAVSKTFPVEAILEAYRAGQRAFAENKAQELAAKAPLLPADIEWHFIGHLQGNKVAQVLRHAAWIHSVDSVKLLQRIDRLAGEAGVTPNILLELNLGAEADKTGAPESMLPELVAAARAATHLHWQGLMCMAPLDADEVTTRRVFSRLRELLSQHAPELTELSMGMSGDYAIAIACGSTMVRIGTAIFGKR